MAYFEPFGGSVTLFECIWSLCSSILSYLEPLGFYLSHLEPLGLYLKPFAAPGVLFEVIWSLPGFILNRLEHLPQAKKPKPKYKLYKSGLVLKWPPK